MTLQRVGGVDACVIDTAVHSDLGTNGKERISVPAGRRPTRTRDRDRRTSVVLGGPNGQPIEMRNSEGGSWEKS
jgi:hypothetical protein